MKTLPAAIVEFILTAPKTRPVASFDVAIKTVAVYFCHGSPLLMEALCVIQILQAAAQLVILNDTKEKVNDTKEKVNNARDNIENIEYYQLINGIKIGVLLLTGFMYAGSLILLPTIIYIVGNLMTDGMSFLLPQQNFTDVIKRPSPVISNTK
jgi:hypothetical protein